MYTRLIETKIAEALAESPVVLIDGARQVGKTTLVRSLLPQHGSRTYRTLDDTTTLSAARADPVGFLFGFAGSLTLDEVQKAPDLFPAIKLLVDERRTPGRFLLTGSANVLTLPRMSESLAGRMEILSLWPLSQMEIENRRGSLCDSLFSARLEPSGRQTEELRTLVDRIVKGGYPEPLGRSQRSRRDAWFRSYLTTILERDVRDISNIEGRADMPRLLSLLASRVGGILNLSDISRSMSMPYATLHRYTALLQSTFLVCLLPAWSGNLGLRLTKSPKLFLNDTGLVVSVLGLDAERLVAQGGILGHLFENLVYTELQKHVGWSDINPRMYHFRSHSGHEVDFVLEDSSGRIVGIEAKLSATVQANDFKGLRFLAEQVGPRFHRGVVLYTGRSMVPFGSNMAALPASELWS